MEIIKGSAFDIEATIYRVWTGDLSTSVPEDLTDAEVKCIVKIGVSDKDSDAVLTKDGVITDAVEGLCTVSFDADDTNDLSYAKIYYEIVAKLADGKIRRTGLKELYINSNLMKDLF
jgi:hypothetical protein